MVLGCPGRRGDHRDAEASARGDQPGLRRCGPGRAGRADPQLSLRGPDRGQPDRRPRRHADEKAQRPGPPPDRPQGRLPAFHLGLAGTSGQQRVRARYPHDQAEAENIRVPAHRCRRPAILRDPELPLDRRQARAQLLRCPRYAHRRPALDARHYLITPSRFVTPDQLRLMQGPAHAGRKYWAILLMFGLVGAALFTVDAVMSLPSQVHSITQAVGEALVVAVVVSLVVEPRLLRYFGEELSSQTFWASFYSRAPDAYRDRAP